ncbi:phage tail assembly chaperone G [Staphylococcus cohnii]
MKPINPDVPDEYKCTSDYREIPREYLNSRIPEGRGIVKWQAVTDTEGNAKYDTFITPTQIPFRKIYDAADLMDGASEENASAQENIDQMLDMVVDIYNNQFTKDDLLDRLHAPDAVEELQGQIEFIAQGQMDEERKKELARII